MFHILSIKSNIPVPVLECLSSSGMSLHLSRQQEAFRQDHPEILAYRYKKKENLNI
jgi:hypothetical protein